MFFKKIVALNILVAISFQPSRPISDTMVAVCSVGGGVLVGSATGAVVKHITTTDHHSYSNTPAIIRGTAAGLAAGGLIYYILSKYTPDAHFNYASSIISSLSMDSLINSDINDAENSTARITASFGTSWPLVLGRERLMQNTQSLRLALTSLDTAYTEGCQDRAKYGMIIQGYPGLLATASAIHGRIENVLAFISSHPRYDQQVALYERHQEKEAKRRLLRKKIKHKAQLAAAKMSHSSHEARQEREYKKDENRKDREMVGGRINNAQVHVNLGGR